MGPNPQPEDQAMHVDPSTSRTTLPVNLAAAALGALATGIAIYVLGRASETFPQHLALVLVAAGIAVAGIWLAPGGRGVARIWAIGGIAATLAVAIAAGGALSRPAEVNEQVITADAVTPADAMAKGDDTSKEGTQAKGDSTKASAGGAMTKEPAAPAKNALLASGQFEALEHAGAGRASIIRTAGGRHVLTLTGFSTDAGPDLDVRLVAGDPATDDDVEAGRSIRLGKLKGTSGDQQYFLPAGVDPSEFTHAYVWCRAFSVGFTRARLA